MKKFTLVYSFLLTFTFVVSATPPDSPTEIDVNEVLRRVAENAKKERKGPPRYEFTRVKRVATYDHRNQPESQGEEIYRMELRGDRLRPKLVSRKGEPLPASDQKDESASAESQEKNCTRPGKTKAAEKGETVLLSVDDDVSKRFRFTLAGRDKVGNRPALIVDVQPRTDLPIEGIEQKLMARMAGRVWVDAEDYEISKAEVRLLDSVPIGLGGILGALHTFDFSVHRQRMPDGGWVNSNVRLYVRYRQLIQTKRFSYEETVRDVQPIAAQHPAG